MTTQDIDHFRTFLVYLRDEEGFEGIDTVLRQLDARTAMNLPPLRPPASSDTEEVTALPAVDDHVLGHAPDGYDDSRVSGHEPRYSPDLVEIALRTVQIGSAIGAAVTAVALLVHHFGH